MNRKSLRPLLRPRTSQLAISKPNLVIKKINEADLSYKKSIAFSGIAFRKASRTTTGYACASGILIGCDGVKDVSKTPRLISTTCDRAFTGRSLLAACLLSCNAATALAPARSKFFRLFIIFWDIFCVDRDRTIQFFGKPEKGKWKA